jgi:ABC-type glycerol-3-phosphate transport system permease component
METASGISGADGGASGMDGGGGKAKGEWARGRNPRIAEGCAAFLKYFFLVVFCGIVFYPLLYAILGSFKSNYEVTLGGTLFPREWFPSNYTEAWGQFNFLRYSLNSVVLSVLTTAISLAVCSMAGYCLARKEFPGRRLLEWVILATMFIAIGTVTLRPIYLMMVKLRLHNTLLPVALIVVSANMGTNIFLVSKFIRTIPRELDEAAYIDGAGIFRIYWQIIIPLIVPILGVVGLFSFRSAWNDYINANVFTMSQPLLRPLTVGVISLRYGVMSAAQWNIMLAGAALSIVPMLIVYAFTNKTFISGLSAGAVKG